MSAATQTTQTFAVIFKERMMDMPEKEEEQSGQGWQREA